MVINAAELAGQVALHLLGNGLTTPQPAEDARSSTPPALHISLHQQS